MDRRLFLQSIAAGVVPVVVRDLHAGLGTDRGAGPGDAIAVRKAVLISMLPKELSYAQRFKVARETSANFPEPGAGYREHLFRQLRRLSALGPGSTIDE